MSAAKYQHANAWSPTSMALLLRGVVALDIAAWPGPGAYSVDGNFLFPLVLCLIRLCLQNNQTSFREKATL